MSESAWNVSKCEDKCDLNTCTDIKEATLISLRGCKLKEMPEGLKRAVNLKTLDLAYNKLSKINAEDLPSSLRELNLYRNKFDKVNNLPKGLKQLNIQGQYGKATKKNYRVDAMRTDADLPDGIEEVWADGDFCKKNLYIERVFGEGKHGRYRFSQIVKRLSDNKKLHCDYVRNNPY